MNPVDVAQICYEAGFRGERGVRAVALIGAETAGTFDPSITNTTGNSPPDSVDRGLWMWNSHWHPEVSDACAFDPLCATKAAYDLSDGGVNFSAWVAFTNGSYEKYLKLAAVAWEAAKRLRGRDARIATLEAKLVDLNAQFSETLDLHEAELAGLNAERDSILAKVSQLEAEVVTNQISANSLRDERDVLAGRLAAAEAGFDDVAADIRARIFPE